MSTSASNVKVTILTWLVKMTHKISCCSTLCRFMLKIVVTKKGSQSQTKWILEFNFTTKRFVKITHGNIVASHTLVLATPRFELNWVSKACVSIFPSTRGAHSADQCAVTVAWSVGGPDSRAELKTDLSFFAQFLRRKICVKNSKQNNIRKILWISLKSSIARKSI